MQTGQVPAAGASWSCAFCGTTWSLREASCAACGETYEASVALEAAAAEEARATELAAATKAASTLPPSSSSHSVDDVATPAFPRPASTRRRRSKAPILVGVLAVLTLAGLAVAMTRGTGSDSTSVESQERAESAPAPAAASSPSADAADVEPATVDQGDVETTATIASAPADEAGGAAVQVPEQTEAAPEVVPSAQPLQGDLGLTIAMTQPPCDGRFITLIGATVTPGQYESQTASILQTYPSSNYLLTEITCSSLRGRTDAGNQIYSVYFGPFDTAEQACAARGFGPSDAYVKRLDNVTSPSDGVDC